MPRTAQCRLGGVDIELVDIADPVVAVEDAEVPVFPQKERRGHLPEGVEPLRQIPLRDHLARPVAHDVQRETSARLVDQPRRECQLVRLRLECARVLPLTQPEAGHRREVHQQDLILGILAGVGVLEREASMAEVDVRSSFQLGSLGRFEERITQHQLVKTRRRDGEDFVLVVVARPQPCRPVRSAEPPLVHSGYMQVFGHPPRARRAVVSRPAVFHAKQRRPVAPNQRVDGVPILDVESRHGEVVDILDYGIGRLRGHAAHVHAAEFRHATHPERAGGRHQATIALVLVQRTQLGRVGDRAAQAPNAGERQAGIVLVPIQRALIQRPRIRWSA